MCPNCRYTKLTGHYGLKKMDTKYLYLHVLARNIQNFVITGYRGTEVAHIEIAHEDLNLLPAARLHLHLPSNHLYRTELAELCLAPKLSSSTVSLPQQSM